MKRVGYWLAGVLIALDVLASSLIGGQHGETLSHYAARHMDTWGGPLCAALDLIDPGHCAKVRY